MAKLKFTIDDPIELPGPLREFYEKSESDGKYRLALDGDSPRLSEFRKNNLALIAERDALKAQAEADKATVAELTAKKPDTSKIEADLAAERKAYAALLLRATITQEFQKQGGRSSACDFMVGEAARAFTVEDGKLVAKEFSSSDPSQPLSVEEFIAKQATVASFAFQPSHGGGARGSVPGARFGAPSKQNVLKNPTAQQLGQHAADIAAGRIKVEHS